MALFLHLVLDFLGDVFTVSVCEVWDTPIFLIILKSLVYRLGAGKAWMNDGTRVSLIMGKFCHSIDILHFITSLFIFQVFGLTKTNHCMYLSWNVRPPTLHQLLQTKTHPILFPYSRNPLTKPPESSASAARQGRKIRRKIRRSHFVWRVLIARPHSPRPSRPP